MTTVTANDAFDWKALGRDVILQAFRDLRDPDPLTALDALLWLISDAPFWLDGLGMDYDPVRVLVSGKLPKVVRHARQ
jgi:hypothetical protein